MVLRRDVRRIFVRREIRFRQDDRAAFAVVLEDVTVFANPAGARCGQRVDTLRQRDSRGIRTKVAIVPGDLDGVARSDVRAGKDKFNLPVLSGARATVR